MRQDIHEHFAGFLKYLRLGGFFWRHGNGKMLFQFCFEYVFQKYPLIMEDQSNNNDEKLRSKDTRWDRIRKRHTNTINVKTETVKKLFAIDFVGRKQLKTLNGDLLNDPVLDPVLVMDLRHEIVNICSLLMINQITYVYKKLRKILDKTSTKKKA